MLLVHLGLNDGEEWCTYYRYTDDFRVEFQASPAAVSGYDEAYPALVTPVEPPDPSYLRGDAGLIRTYSYHPASGYVASETVQEGTGGSASVLYERDYCQCDKNCACAGSSSSSSSSSGGGPLNDETGWFLSEETVYPEPGVAETTRYCYSFYPGTCSVYERVTTLPAVLTDQNGSGVPATRRDVFDTYRQLIWSMDERGYISYFVYDNTTGELIQRIDDVNTEGFPGVPVGWLTPHDGGKHLITDYQQDALGRVIQQLGPVHSIDVDGEATDVRRALWVVYDDEHHVSYTGQGYATGTEPDYEYTLINPVSIIKMDADGRVNEQIQAQSESVEGSLAEIIEAAGGGEAAFPQSWYTRWTTYQYTDCCLAASMRVYHTIPDTGEGAEGTNYDETDYGYDVMKRRNRTVTPGGTITFSVYDIQGRLTGVYVGTNDAGATDQDPTGGGHDPSNNMVLVTQNQYDDDLSGGDGFLTSQTQFVDEWTERVTQFGYDFRGRRLTIDGEVDFFQLDEYDNLSRVIKSERHNTVGPDTPPGSSSSSPGEGNLIGRTEMKYDARGRVFQTIRYGVDPETGAVGNSLVSNTWFDDAGNVLASRPAGSALFTKAVYDSLGRVITQYVGYNPETDAENPLGDGTPDSVDTDVILEQSETDYDDASNVIAALQRQRYHNEADTELGALASPGLEPKARVTYVAQYADPLGRTVAVANYGTNGGTPLSRPDEIPGSSSSHLVSMTVFDAAGNVLEAVDPAEMVVRFEYDDVGRRITLIENYQEFPSSSSGAAGTCEPSDDINRTTQFTYTADGLQATLVAVNGETGNQTTTYTYGTTLDESGVATSNLLRSIAYPDSSGLSDKVFFTYNRQGNGQRPPTSAAASTRISMTCSAG